MKNSRTKRLSTRIRRYTEGWWLLAVFAAISIASSVYLAYLPLDGTESCLVQADRLGSWMSGIGAIFLQSMTLIAIVVFSSLQLREQRKQTTMNNFFELLKRYDEAVSRLSNLAPGALHPHRGRDAFEVLVGEVERKSRETNADVAVVGKEVWRNEDRFGEWLRAIQMIVSFMRDEAQRDEKRYMKILRAYLSHYEAQALIAFYASKEGGSGTGSFLQKHKAFKYAFSRQFERNEIWRKFEKRLDVMLDDEEL